VVGLIALQWSLIDELPEQIRRLSSEWLGFAEQHLLRGKLHRESPSQGTQRVSANQFAHISLLERRSKGKRPPEVIAQENAIKVTFSPETCTRHISPSFPLSQP
jgi:hypothetical protein